MPEDHLPSWAERENQRVTALKLEELTNAIEKLSDKIELMNEKSRDRSSLFETKINTELTNVNVKIAMMEVKMKIWAGVFGVASSAISTALIELLFGKTLK